MDKLHKQYQKVKQDSSKITAGITSASYLQAYPMFKKYAYDFFSLCYPSIISCTSYPTVKKDNRTERRTRGNAKHFKIKLSTIEPDVRFHLGMIACYKIIDLYYRKGKGQYVWKYVSDRLPLYYIHELRKHLYTPPVYAYDPSETIPESIVLPESGYEYIENIGISITEYIDTYFRYLNRPNFYRIKKAVELLSQS